ncbi:UPF0602 protein C4orf47-like protein, partial [Bienertia sinuspersici]
MIENNARWVSANWLTQRRPRKNHYMEATEETYAKEVCASRLSETNNVETYFAEFEKMCMLCNLIEKEEHKIARFMAGLNLVTSEKVDVQPYWSSKELCKVARHVEKDRKPTPQKTNPRTYY